MKLEQSLLVQAPLDQVWQALVDVERVAPCLPGATLTRGAEEGTYEGTFAVRLGPASASYEGTLTMESLDAASRTTTMRANGRDHRGAGSATATIVSRLVPEGEAATRLEVVTDFSITGRLARFGRGGMIEDVSTRLLREFGACLQQRLAAPEEPAPAAAAAAAPAPAGEPPPAPPAPSDDAVAAAGAGAGSAAAPDPTPASPPRPAAAPAAPRNEVNALGLLLGILRDGLARLFGRGRR